LSADGRTPAAVREGVQMPQTVLITGAAGFIGENIAHRFRGEPHRLLLVCGSRRPRAQADACVSADLAERGAFTRAVKGLQADTVVHTAAVVNPDACQRDPERAHAVNVAGTREVACWAEERGARMIYFSTDLVYGGDRSFYREEDPTGPTNVYGATKLAGEEEVRRACSDWVILRLALSYGPTRGALGDWTWKMREALRQGKDLPLFTDQFRTPAHAGDTTEAVFRLAGGRGGGLYHMGGRDRVSRFEFGVRFVRAFGLPADRVRPVRMADLPLDAPRAAGCSLNTRGGSGSAGRNDAGGKETMEADGRRAPGPGAGGAAVPPLLAIRGLRTGFATDRGWIWAADGVDLEVRSGRTLCLVGESGCGKTVTGLSVLGLVPSQRGRIVEGSVLFGGTDLTQLSDREMRGVRGNRISMIFQEPMTSLNPVFGIGGQVAETVRVHRKATRRQARERALSMLADVGFPSPERRYGDPPCLLSGGMRQRVMIAMALCCEPDLLIADEPTTALDVTIQAQILRLMAGLQERMGMGILFITHDLGVVAEIADEVAVMYAGRVVETGPVEALFREPRHPYTIGLLRSIPGPAAAAAATGKRRLPAIPGGVPDLANLPVGCRFQERCAWVIARCRAEDPPLLPVPDPTGARRGSACWRHHELAGSAGGNP